MSERQVVPHAEFPLGNTMGEQSLDPEKITIKSGEQWFCSSDTRHLSFYFQGHLSRPKALSLGSALNVSPPNFSPMQLFDNFGDSASSFVQSAVDPSTADSSFFFENAATSLAPSYDPQNFTLASNSTEAYSEFPMQAHRSHRMLFQKQLRLHLVTLASSASRLLIQNLAQQETKSAEDDQLPVRSGVGMEITGQTQDSTWILQLALQQQQRGLIEPPVVEPPETPRNLNTHKETDSPTSSPGGTINGQSRNSSTSSASTGAYPHVVKPKIATTFWEDENTVCYQVRARGVLVSRREDTDYVNGTKLLNVIGMTRGKRDGMLKTEKTRQVVKVGSMNLKGVWIPFDRAAEIARNEGVSDILHPLFIRDLKSYYNTKGYKLRTSPTTGGEAGIGDTSPTIVEPGTPVVAANYEILPLDTITQLSNELTGYEGLEVLNTDFSMMRCDLLEPQPALMDMKENFRLSYYTPAQIQSSEDAAQ